MNRPIFRKEDGGSLVFDMVDDYGRTWSRGSGTSRTQAIGNARMNQPPAGIRRSILLAAKHHPMRAAFLTGTAFHTYRAIQAMRHGEKGPSLLQLAVFSVVAYVGLKILTHFVKDDE
jgi:hypothetical protein